MKVLVCVKMVVDLDMVLSDTWEEVNLTGYPDIEYANKIMNYYDACSLEMALRLRNSYEGQIEIHVLTIGKEGSERIMNSALSLGIDKAIRVDCELNLDINPNITAEILQKVAASEEKYDLIFLGEQAGPYDNSQTGLLFAEKMKLPCVTHVLEVKMIGEYVVVIHQNDWGLETLKLTTPVVLIIGNTSEVSLRIPTLLDKMNARNKKVITRTFSETAPVEYDQASGEYDNPKLHYPLRQRTCQWIIADTVEQKAGMLNDLIMQLKTSKV